MYKKKNNNNNARIAIIFFAFVIFRMKTAICDVRAVYEMIFFFRNTCWQRGRRGL